MAPVFGLPMHFRFRHRACYTSLSVTGVYIWWKKRRARKFSKAHRGVAAGVEEVAAE